MGKKIKIAPEGSVNFITLPGNNATLTGTSEILDDTTFQSDYKSNRPDIKGWEAGTNAIYKGFAGYQTVIKKTGIRITFTGESMTLVSGKTYVIDAEIKNIFDLSTAIIVYDGGTDVTDEIEKINYLFGEVIFKSTYTVTGSVTIDGAYLPNTQICAMNNFSLTQGAETKEQTDLCIAQTNGGYRQFAMGLKNIELELTGFYRKSSGFWEAFEAAETVVIELNPDGLGKSVARGFFIPSATGQSGNVGATEEATVSYVLSSPDNEKSLVPFSWKHTTDTTLNQGIITLLDSMVDLTPIEMQYLEDGLNGRQGTAILTNMSIAGGLGNLSQFDISLMGSGGLTDVT